MTADIGLALSGGGVRAAVFHTGVLLRFAKSNLLEETVRISTVSGGSLLVGLIFSLNNHKWPSSEEYSKRIYPMIQSILTGADLFTPAVLLKTPLQYHRLLLHRSHILETLLEKIWGVKGNLESLPDKPSWIINTTSLLTGKNWRFSREEMGDWKFGKHYSPPFSIAKAISASASVPYVIGGHSFKLPQSGWHKTDPATSRKKHEVMPCAQKVKLWDGGAYENLGLEPLYKTDRGMINCKNILLIDASAPLDTNYSFFRTLCQLFKMNLISPRLFDVTSDQIRSLRSRMFMDAIISKKVSGSLIKIGNTVNYIHDRAKYSSSDFDYTQVLSDQSVQAARDYPTNLASIPEDDFSLIARHGFECADATLMCYRMDLSPERYIWTS